MRSSRSRSGVRTATPARCRSASRPPWSAISSSSRRCRVMSCGRRARPRSPLSACSRRVRNKHDRMPASHFGREWLAWRLAQLLPEYPAVSVCVALSGGVNFTVLLAALSVRRPQRLELRAVHVDHGLHPNSSAWSEHCRAFAQRCGVPITVMKASIVRGRGASLEAAAREARYALLSQTLGAGECLLTAHQADDQLETVLLQLFRGAGLAGLAAMPERAPFGRGWLLRPLLSRSRAELTQWARKARLSWIEDESNAEERFDRNYLR